MTRTQKEKVFKRKKKGGKVEKKKKGAWERTGEVEGEENERKVKEERQENDSKKAYHSMNATPQPPQNRVGLVHPIDSGANLNLTTKKSIQINIFTFKRSPIKDCTSF